MSPLHCYVKLCASFPSHRWIVTKVSVRKRSSRETIGSYCRVWPWNATYDIEKNNRGSFLSCVKQCTSFRSHRWILTGDTVRKHSIRAKFLPLWPWKSRDELQKQQNTSPKPHQAYTSFHRHMWNQTGVTAPRELNRGWPLWPIPLTSDLYLLHGHHFLGNHSWKFHGATIKVTLSNRCDRRTDRRTNRRANGGTEPLTELLGHSYKFCDITFKTFKNM